MRGLLVKAAFYMSAVPEIAGAHSPPLNPPAEVASLAVSGLLVKVRSILHVRCVRFIKEEEWIQVERGV